MGSLSEQLHQEDLQRLRGLRLIDDDFMTICFEDNIEAAQLLLDIILDRTDLKVSEVKTQKVMKNLQGRDVWLDIYATDSDGKKYDIEVQRADRGAHQKRARYHSSMVDADMLKAGEDFTELRENYVIFITENDVIGQGEPIYHIDRYIKEGNLIFDDGEHIIYVNGSVKSKETALGKLMSDFFCTEAKDMCYKELSDRVRFYKETEKGVESMCKALEDMRKEAVERERVDCALRMINIGIAFDVISEATQLPIEKVRELAGEQTA